MKRTAKILSVVIALACVLGAFAIVSAADEVTGVNVTKEGYFDGIDPSYEILASAGNPAGTGYAWTMSGRSGKVSIGLSADGQETPNQYMIIHNAPKAGNSHPYFGTGYGGAGSAGLANKTQRPTITNDVLSLNGTDIAEWPYLVMDLDIMSPTAKWYGTIGLQARAFLAGDTGLDTETTLGIPLNVRTPILFNTDENGTYLANGEGTVKKYVDPNQFTHITLIYESVAKEAVRGCNVYVYVDGELFLNYEGNDVSKGNNPDAYYASTPHMSYDEIRFNWNVSDDADLSFGLDNIVTRLFDTTYNGNLATVLAAKNNLNDWESNLYNEDEMPVGVACAEVDGVGFDSIEKAVAATAEGGTLKLLKSITTQVELSKIMTIDLNGFTGNFTNGEGFALDYETEGYIKVMSSVGMTTLVLWDDCLHDPMCEDYDLNHPLFHEAELAINEKLLGAYDPTFSGFLGGDTSKVYVLIGWKNAMTGEAITADTVVTEDDVAAGFIMLEPVYKIAVKNYEYVQGGVTKEVYDNQLSLKEVIAAADANSTVKLCSDVEYKQVGGSAYIDIGKVLTLDLNGYTLKAYGTDKAKSALFRMTSGTDITVTSSVVGGKLFHEGWNSAGTTPQSAGVFNASNDTGIFRIKGNNAEGEITLTIFAGCLAEGYSNALQYYIDGGMFVCKNGSDQMGYIDSRKAGRDSEIKNAFFYVPAHGQLLGYVGRNAAADPTKTATVTVDNCVVIGNLTASGFVAPQQAVVTNSYITGNVRPIVSATYSGNTPGSVVIGNGNYFGTALDLALNISFAEGVKLYDVPNSFEFTYWYNTWTKGDAAATFAPSSFEVTTVNGTLDFISMSTDVEPDFVTIIWKDAEGNVLGESEALAGMEASVPADLKVSEVVVPGWLGAVPAEWNESLTVPAGVEEYVITAKDGGATTLVPIVELYGNISISAHFTFNMYIPVRPEGIELTYVTYAGTGTNRLANVSGTYIINGQECNKTSGWPGIINSINDMAAGIQFTYEGETYSVDTTFSMVKYCEYIMNYNGENGYTDDAKALVVNAANYILKSGVVTHKTLSDIVANNSQYIKTIAKASLPELPAIGDYVASAQVVIGTRGPQFRFNLTEAGKAATVTITGSNNVDYANKGYVETKNDRPLAELNRVTLTIVVDEETTITAKYSLVDYYTMLKAGGADQTSLEFVDAMYGFHAAAVDYAN